MYPTNLNPPTPPPPAHNCIELKIFLLFSLVDLAHLFTFGYLKFLISQAIFSTVNFQSELLINTEFLLTFSMVRCTEVV